MINVTYAIHSLSVVSHPSFLIIRRLVICLNCTISCPFQPSSFYSKVVLMFS